MKYLFLILSLTFFDNSCTESNINQDAISLEYSAQSRGIYKNIKINKKNISVKNKRETPGLNKTCSAVRWKNILKALKSINVKNIPNLKAPSQNRFFDGAAIARLKVIYNSKTYETPSFDHGNPPKEIALLVKEILSTAKNIE